MTALKKVANETVDRLTSEDSPYFKPIKYAGGALAIIGLLIKGVALFTPAMPVAAVSLAGDFVTVGLTLFGASILTKDQKKPDASVTKGKSGWRKTFAIIKNLA